MKRIYTILGIIVVTILCIIVILLSSCNETHGGSGKVKDMSNGIEEKSILNNINDTLEDAVEQRNKEVAQKKINFGSLTTETTGSKYMLEIKLSQSRLSLDLWEHLKDSMNAVTFHIETSKSYYDSVQVGQNIFKKGRTGSLIVKGDFTSWNMKVVRKYTE